MMVSSTADIQSVEMAAVESDPLYMNDAPSLTSLITGPLCTGCVLTRRESLAPAHVNAVDDGSWCPGIHCTEILLISTLSGS